MPSLFTGGKSRKSLMASGENIIWIASTVVFVLLIGAWMLYAYNPYVQDKVAAFLHPAQAQKQYTLPLTIVYDATDAAKKKEISTFLASLVDPQKGLKSTKIQDKLLDYKTPEGEKIIKEIDANYLPIAFFDKTVAQHPQFSGLQPYLQKKGDNYYFHLHPSFHLKSPAPDGGHLKGEDAAKAKVVIVEYGSYTCHYCRDMEEVIAKIMKDYAGKIALSYKFFDRNQVDGFLAQAAQCADDQGKFWQMHDLLFKDQPQMVAMLQKLQGDFKPSLSDYLKKKAAAAGLKSKDFASCYASNKYAAKSLDSSKEGVDFGVDGTPAFFVNGMLHDGAYPYEDFKKFIEESLK